MNKPVKDGVRFYNNGLDADADMLGCKWDVCRLVFEKAQLVVVEGSSRNTDWYGFEIAEAL